MHRNGRMLLNFLDNICKNLRYKKNGKSDLKYQVKHFSLKTII